MSNKVFANGMELACKSGAGKAIAGMPDVCLSPPTPPAGPVPIPYPNTANASDTTDGSTTVKVSNKEVMLKDKSNFKKSMGDEAATKSLGMNVVTHCIQGKLYFAMWSMDVKFEGENVVRHMDLTTGNHNPPPGGRAAPWNFQDTTATENIKECKAVVRKYKKACAGQKPNKCSKKCKAAQKCVLLRKDKDKEFCCEPDTTGHHIVEVHCFTPTGGRGAGERLPGCGDYRDGAAPCTCASESRADGFHGVMHAVQSQFEALFMSARKVIHRFIGAGPLRPDGSRAPGVSHWTYGEARDAGAKALKIAAGCPEECTKKQLDQYHKDEAGLKEDTPLRSDPGADGRSSGTLTPAQQGQVTRAENALRGVIAASPF